MFMDGTPAGTKERLFQDIAAVEGGIRARLLLDSLDERDLLYRALTEPAYATNLIVRRSALVAIPLLLADSAVPTLSSGTIVLRPNQGLDLVTGSAGDGSSAHIRWTSEKKIAPLGGVQFCPAREAGFRAGRVWDVKSSAPRAHGTIERSGVGRELGGERDSALESSRKRRRL
jgi:hypothetical protein